MRLPLLHDYVFVVDGIGPVVFDGISESVKRPDTRIVIPGEGDLSNATRSDELVIDEIRRHADDGQLAY